MLLPLSQLPASLLPALAALHKATMPTLLSDLGDNFVLRYYQIAQKDPTVIAICALDDHPEPLSTSHVSRVTLGYALGSPDPAALNAQLRRPLSWFAVQMLKLAFSNPRVLLQLAQSVLTASKANSLKPGQIELTYIGVAPEARGQGLGKSILLAFVESARTAGYTSVVLSVETDNPAALALYTRFGFTITQTFSEGSYNRHRMEYQI
ncbi:MAG: GNAT family N-acetyltransferase [Anaerolineae bacterium]|nr:GNAT family N-acetyltransferase [Anaerolineae bacterium]